MSTWFEKGLASDSRIGPAFLFPGVGYGGSCFPKDTRALIETGREHGYDMKILEAVHSVNVEQATRFVERISSHFGGKLKGKRFGVWGLSFKPRTNDMRDAPAITIIEGAARSREQPLQPTIPKPWTKRDEFSDRAFNSVRIIMLAWKERTRSS